LVQRLQIFPNIDGKLTMRFTWYATVAMFILVLGAPSLLAQDFLKQLEQKLFQKQQEEKEKKEAADAQPPESEGTLQFPDVEASDSESVETLPSPVAPELLPSQEADAEANAEKTTPPPPAPGKKSSRANQTLPKKPSNTANPLTLPASPFPTKNTSPKPLNRQPEPPLAGGGFLGLTVENLPGGGFGLTVVEVANNSPAWKAGFRNGDRVIGVAGQAVTTVDSFADQLSRYAPGEPVKFLVERRGRNANLIAVLQDRSIAGQIHGNRPGTAIELAPEGTSRDYVPIASRAFFGLNVGNLSDAFRRQFAIPTYRGAAVTGVVAQSPAASAGLKPGDCIVDMDGVAVQSPEMVYDIVKQCKPGQVISVSYYRGSQLTTASVPLAIDESMPPSQANDRSFPSEMLTPEYVESLQVELNRVNEELALTQERLQNLEARLQQIEKKR
jgi:hypothetical protein